MNLENLYEYCLSKKGVTEHFPFDDDTLVFKVGGKMFCLTSLKRWEQGEHSINLKCDPGYAVELREQYDAVNPGYHMSKIHWNTVDADKDLAIKELIKLIDHSYDLVFRSLTKKLQVEIAQLDS
jgi:predicted DNA-binding protein (MmcQ/YjbR family)